MKSKYNIDVRGYYFRLPEKWASYRIYLFNQNIKGLVLAIIFFFLSERERGLPRQKGPLYLPLHLINKRPTPTLELNGLTKLPYLPANFRLSQKSPGL